MLRSLSLYNTIEKHLNFEQVIMQSVLYVKKIMSLSAAVGGAICMQGESYGVCTVFQVRDGGSPAEDDGDISRIAGEIESGGDS